MDTPELPDFTQLTHTSTLELAKAVLTQYKANVRWMSAIITVLKEGGEPPAQSPKQSSPVFLRTAVYQHAHQHCVFAVAIHLSLSSSVVRAAAEPNSNN